MSAATTTEATERRIPMTYDEWLRWADSGRQAEWVAGEAIEFMPPTLRHMRMIWFLATLVGLFVRRRGIGELVVSPFEMKLRDDRSREPDLLFVSTANATRLQEARLVGAADLAIEIVSDDSVTRDNVVKRHEYAAAGVAEYWILDPRPGKEREEFLVLGADGRYAAVPPDDDGWYHSRVMDGFRLRIGWLRADPLPDPLACLAEIEADLG